MGTCTSKPWEIDSRDICQGLRCFFACCKGQILVHATDGVFSHVVKDKFLFMLQMVLKSKTLRKMSKKTYDPCLVWPYSLLLCGQTCCGKTTWIVELLKSHKKLCTHTPKNLIWIYGVEQPDLFKPVVYSSDLILTLFFVRIETSNDKGHAHFIFVQIQTSNDKGQKLYFFVQIETSND